jgi:hypothetical protein
MRRDQCQKFDPRHDQIHLVEKDLLAHAPSAQIKAKVLLFHAVIDCNLRASVAYLAE